MHLYLRLLQEDGGETYTDAEKEHVYACLSKAPGVERVKEINRHPKGGYAVTFDGTKESIEALLEYVSSHGFRPVF